MKRYYKLCYLPDFSFPQYMQLSISSYEDYLLINERFLRELHSIGVLYNLKVSFHMLFFFKDKWEILFYFNSDNETDLKLVDGFLKQSKIFKVFSLESIEPDHLINTVFSDVSILQKRISPVKVNSLKEYEIKNHLQEPVFEVITPWESDVSANWCEILELIESDKSCIAIRMDIIPSWCQSQWVNDSSEILNDIKQRSAFGGMTDNGSSSSIQKNLQKFTDMLSSSPNFYLNLVVLTQQEGLSKIICNNIGSQLCLNNAFKTVYFSSDECKTFDFGETVILSLSCLNYQNIISALYNYTSVFGTQELKTIFSFPIASFGTILKYPKEGDFPSNLSKKSVLIGHSDNGQAFNVPINSFSRHAFICGMTGSGKTRCMFQIITELNTHNIPFLLIEPVKKEYRSVIPYLSKVNFFSPGADSVFQIHINPFEFPDGVVLSEHIDNLLLVFKGAFYLPTPSPAILENAIECAYREKGWFPHMRNSPSQRKNKNLSYPDFSDIKRWIEEEMTKTKYRTEFQNDIIAILQNRIDSLMCRHKGDIYNCRISTIQPDQWIKLSVILELNSLSESDANFMTLLISIYIRETLDLDYTEDGLRHVICYEEAHNLIGQDNTTHSELSTDNPDPKIVAGKFIEKMLEESRALGEGIIISDQIPTHMPDTVIKNTDLKLVFRLIASDDKEAMSSAISSTAYLSKMMTHLKPAQTISFYQDMKAPQIINVEDWDDSKVLYLSDNKLTQILRSSKDYWVYYDVDCVAIRDQGSKKLEKLRYNLITSDKVDLNEFSQKYTRVFDEYMSKFPTENENNTIEPIKLICDYFDIFSLVDWKLTDKLSIFKEIDAAFSETHRIFGDLIRRASNGLLDFLYKNEKNKLKIERLQQRINVAKVNYFMSRINGYYSVFYDNKAEYTNEFIVGIIQIYSVSKNLIDSYVSYDYLAVNSHNMLLFSKLFCNNIIDSPILLSAEQNTLKALKDIITEILTHINTNSDHDEINTLQSFKSKLNEFLRKTS